ncbi:hypothetical protein [Microcoleus sp. BROC3]|uniref:hypothetical protein n=1 Tax=Microcoleus sp. BROC3 TaxID=3055323 RepID=UPI002FD72646
MTPQDAESGFSRNLYRQKYDRTSAPASKSSGVSHFGAEAASAAAQIQSKAEGIRVQCDKNATNRQ